MQQKATQWKTWCNIIKQWQYLLETHSNPRCFKFKWAYCTFWMLIVGTCCLILHVSLLYISGHRYLLATMQVNLVVPHAKNPQSSILRLVPISAPGCLATYNKSHLAFHYLFSVSTWKPVCLIGVPCCQVRTTSEEYSCSNAKETGDYNYIIRTKITACILYQATIIVTYFSLWCTSRLSRHIPLFQLTATRHCSFAGTNWLCLTAKITNINSEWKCQLEWESDNMHIDLTVKLQKA